MRHKMILVAVALVVALLAWYGLSQGKEPTSLLSTESTSNPADQDLIETLLALRAVKLEGTIFTEPVFQNLTDFSTQIIPEPIGRPNPFAPLEGSTGSSASSTKNTQIFNGSSKGVSKPKGN